MRYVCLLAIALLLGSCSKAIKLIVENRSGTRVIMVSRDRIGERSYVLEMNSLQEINWPDPNHDITVGADGCFRKFNLDEFYSPWNDWRDSNGELSRRYVVARSGELQIVRPDADHVAYNDLTNPPAWQTKNLTRLSEQCDEASR